MEEKILTNGLNIKSDVGININSLTGRKKPKILIDGKEIGQGGGTPYIFDEDSFIEVNIPNSLKDVALAPVISEDSPECEINWGDGIIDIVNKPSQSGSVIIHTYAEAGTYLIKVKGAFTFYLGGSNTSLANWADKITKVKYNIPKSTKISGDIFKGCSILEMVDISNMNYITDTTYMFSSCKNLISIPKLDTSQVTIMDSMFLGCNKLVSIPELDTSNVATMKDMFNSCIKLTRIPSLNTSKVGNMKSIFQSCGDLISIPKLDTSKVTIMDSMFAGCYDLIEIPKLDTSKVYDMKSMFSYCKSLTSIPLLNTFKVTEMNHMFKECQKLVTIPTLNCIEVINMVGMFDSCPNIEEIHMINIKADLNISACTKMTRQALNEVISNLINVGQSKTLTVGSTLKSKLTPEDIQVATSKGWTIA